MRRDTRDLIVETAARLFQERGYDGTSVARVLDECSVNSGSLYHFFDSKEDLAVAVIERCIDRLPRRLLDPAGEATGDALGRVAMLFDLIRSDLLAGDGGDGHLVGLLAAELGERRPEIRAASERYHLALARRVRSWLDGAGPQLPSFLDRTGFAEFVATVLQGGLARARAAGGPVAFDGAAAQVEQYLLLLVDAARRERSGETPPTRHVPGERARSESSDQWRSW